MNGAERRREIIVSTTSLENDMIGVDVLDTGCGIEDRLQGQLFDWSSRPRRGAWALVFQYHVYRRGALREDMVSA